MLSTITQACVVTRGVYEQHVVYSILDPELEHLPTEPKILAAVEDLVDASIIYEDEDGYRLTDYAKTKLNTYEIILYGGRILELTGPFSMKALLALAEDGLISLDDQDNLAVMDPVSMEPL